MLYMIMLLEHYDINISKGMKQELETAIEQHGK